MKALSDSASATLDRFADSLWLNDGLSRNTIESYRRDLRQFACWLEDTQQGIC
jgi:integrase/recombinase XerD